MGGDYSGRDLAAQSVRRVGLGAANQVWWIMTRVLDFILWPYYYLRLRWQLHQLKRNTDAMSKEIGKALLPILLKAAEELQHD